MYGRASYGVPPRTAPVEVVELGAVKAMSAGNYYSLAVRMDGQVWGWGNNYSGQLGDGTTLERYTPVRTLDLTDIVAVAAGGQHALALKSDGTVWSWGANSYGQLGDGTTNNRLSPALVQGLSGVKAIAAGNGHSLALKTDGTVWAWGNNSSGELGDGTTTQRTLPYQIVGLSGTAAIAAGSGRAVVVKTDGSVWEWGSGASGSVGTITRVGQLSSATAASTYAHSLVLNANGTVSAWGDNSYGQLGDGTTNYAYPNAPTTVVGLASVVSISTNGYGNSAAVRSDGTVWQWGLNDTGQLPFSGGVYSAPVQTVNLGSYTLSPANINASMAAGSQTVSLTTGNTLQPWAPASSAPWWLTASPASGTNNATLTISWTANSGNAPRTGTITVGSQVVTVTQAAGVTEALRFVATTPCRVVDTRWPVGAFGGPFIGANATRSFVIPQGSCSIPSTAKAYSLNVTVVPRTGRLDWLTLWPAGQAQPIVSTLNSYGGDVVANAAIVPAGTNGAVSVFVTNDTEVIIDINGYFDASTGSSFYADTPCRVADTRWPTAPLGGPVMGEGQTRSFAVPSSTCGIPGNATAYSMNYTVVPSGYLGYLSTWPTGQNLPVVSTLNSWRGRVVANAAIVPAGSGGAVSAFVTDSTHVILDINGHFGAPGGNGALSFYPVTPCRVADTRWAAGPLGGPFMNENSTRSFPLAQGSCGIPATVKAYSVNVTVVPRGPLQWLTMWPAGVGQPVVSTLNSYAGDVVANAAIVPAGTNGAVNVFVTNNTDVILDINGYFQ
jgi:alpha-tubulin suppressor-like RCC1 family protein